MNSELEAIKTAVEGGDFTQARTLADKYVKAHPDQFTDEQTMSIEDCVTSVDVFRAAGKESALWQAEAWLLHRFEAQQIGGNYQPAIRISS